MAKKSFWERSEDDAQKVSAEIVDQIKRGVAPWQKPWKPGELLKPISFDLRFYLGRAEHPERVKEREGQGQLGTSAACSLCEKPSFPNRSARYWE